MDEMKKAGYNQLHTMLLALFLGLFSIGFHAKAMEADEEVDVLDPLIEKLQWNNFKLGGWMRWEYRWKDYGEEDTGPGDFDFNGVAISPSYKSERLKGDASYRFYRYEDDNDWTTFLEYAYLAYLHDEENELYAGIHRVPFGNLPYSSFNFFLSIGWLVGLEDDNDLGVKYIKNADHLNLQLAYYLTDEGHYTGRSDDSARYSADPVKEGDIKNEERHQGNVRLTFPQRPHKDLKVEPGGSVQYGGIRNSSTDDAGDLLAYALHLDTHYKRWNLKLQASRYEYDLRNPPDQSDEVVQMGNFDAAYFIAAKANLYIASLAYNLPLDKWKIDSINFYTNYSYLDKDNHSFTRSQLFVPGMSIDSGRFLIYAEFMYGMNYPYAGPDTFSEGLAKGSGNTDWHTFFKLNIGYYF
jgi:hypothetical protein